MDRSFEFTKESRLKIDQIIAKYPTGKQKSAVMEVLRIAQLQNNNYLSTDAIKAVAQVLNIFETEVMEVASFYTMYNLKPVGKYLIQLCGTTPCMLCGAYDILEAIKTFTGIKNVGDTSADGIFTLMEVECLGACSNAPMVQINDLYYEDLTIESVTNILQDLKNGKDPKVGSQKGRNSAEKI
jgi:NADH-quinone oxidoreductase E subunit